MFENTLNTCSIMVGYDFGGGFIPTSYEEEKKIVVSYFGYGNESLQTVTFVFLVFVVIFITFM